MNHGGRGAAGLYLRCRYLAGMVLVTLAGLFAVAVASAQGGWELDTDRPGQDYSGFDLAAPDPGLCQSACNANPKCRAWSYVKPNTIQGPRPRCWLKSGVPSARASDCCISGVKSGGGSAGGASACFKDTSIRDLDGYSETSGDMTPQKCIATCRSRGFAYAGAQFAAWCFCGNGYGRYGSADNCNMRCNGDPSQICGGSWANSVYDVALGTQVAPGSSVQAPSPAPAGGLGCFKDDFARDLNGYSVTTGDMTVQKCVATCAGRGFAYAGAQFAAWCFCGNTYGRYGRADNCNMACNGDPRQICGGGMANSIYATGIQTGGSVPAGVSPSQDPAVRSLIDEWLRQVERCTRGPHPASYIDPWARICGQLATASADCSVLPDHPPGWDSYAYVWNNNWCHSYYGHRVQDYVRQRQAGRPAAALANCKAEGAACY